MGLDLLHYVPMIKLEAEDSADYIEIDDLSSFPEYIERHGRFITEKDFEEYGKSKVIYFETKGYQRKGMSVEFFLDFKNDELHFDLQSIERAYEYLKQDHINTLEELQRNFQENFINNFVEGKSLFLISW